MERIGRVTKGRTEYSICCISCRHIARIFMHSMSGAENLFRKKGWNVIPGGWCCQTCVIESSAAEHQSEKNGKPCSRCNGEGAVGDVELNPEMCMKCQGTGRA